MKKAILYLSLIIIVSSCGSGDPQAELQALEKQRDELNTRIEQLRQQIQTNGNGETGKIGFVTLKTIKPTLFRHFIKVQGTVLSDNNILIPSTSSGLVKKIHVSEGEKVTKGQVLAELDGAILERTIAEVKTNLELATTIFERQQRLWDKKIGSEVQYLQARTTKESLENRLASLEEQYRLTKVIAPISGTVDQILLKEGEATAAGFGAIRVVTSGDLKIEAKLSENYINQVHLGDTVLVDIPLLGINYTARVRSVSQVIDSRNRTFPVEVTVPASLADIKPNMMAVLKINDYTNPEALTVPVHTIQSSGDNKFLFTAVPQADSELWQVEKQVVYPGLAYDDEVEIKAGLLPNASVVIIGFQNLANGQLVSEGSTAE